MKKIFYSLLILFLALPLSAQVRFVDSDLNGAHNLLFSAEIKNGIHEWKNLYKSDIDTDINSVQAGINQPQLLNCFPEKLDSLRGGKFLQIRNADGVFIYNDAKEILERVSVNDSLSPSPARAAKTQDNLTETALSPDGNWICYLKKKSPSTAALVLSSVVTGQTKILVDTADFSFTNIPVLWSPNSDVLIYENKGHIYFIDPKNAFDFSLAEDKFRHIGEGSIANIVFASAKKLLYINHDLIFSIATNELYTRSLYSSILGSGDVIGKLPTPFHSYKDTFHTDEVGKQIILVQDNKTLVYFDLQEAENIPIAKTLFSHAFLSLSGQGVTYDVFWHGHDKTKKQPVIWLSSLDKKETAAYVLVKNNNNNSSYFSAVDIPPHAHSPVLSADGNFIAFIAPDGENLNKDSLFVYDINLGQSKYIFTGDTVISFAWRNKQSLYVGGSERVQIWNFIDDTKQMLFLSAVEKFGWDETGTRIIAQFPQNNYEYNAEKNTWQSTSVKLSRPYHSMNTHWRIIFDNSNRFEYENIILVRSLEGQSRTRPLIATFLLRTEQKPQVSIIFDAMDNEDGLAFILNTLQDYRLKSSFFINGEFIRRFPKSVLKIVAADHECLSLFYTTADISAPDFLIDENFIRNGLARNEDEFFALTNTDLKLFWHSPFYGYSPLIEKAGRAAGYTLIKNRIQTGDTLTIETAMQKHLEYKNTSELIEDIIAQLHDGAIIPVSVGFNQGTRSDYLYQKLDVLINAIYESGYRIVPISKQYF